MQLEPATVRRLALVITDLDPGGAERALVQLATRLDRSRWQPTVYCLSEPGVLADSLIEAGIPCVCFGARSSYRFGELVLRLARKLKQQHPHVLQSYLHHANLVGRFAARIARVPVVVSGIRVAERRSRLRLWMDRASDRLVTHHVCVSHDVAEFSVEQGGLPAGKISVIGNGVDFERFAHAEPADLSQFGIPADSRTVLYVGRLDPQKGVQHLDETFASTIGRYDDIHFLLVGDGPLRTSLESRVRSMNLEARVHFADWRPDVQSLMRAAYCLVFPSVWEGLPNVVLEAMAAGLPVVATDVEGIRDLIRDGETGLVVSRQSTDEFSQRLQTLLDDPPLAQGLASSAQQFVSERFTWPHVVEQYEALYESLLQGDAGRQAD